LWFDPTGLDFGRPDPSSRIVPNWSHRQCSGIKHDAIIVDSLRYHFQKDFAHMRFAWVTGANRKEIGLLSLGAT